MILNSLILSDKSSEIDEMDEEYQIMYLESYIVDSAFNFFKIKQITSGKGKPPFELKNMIKLIFYTIPYFFKKYLNDLFLLTAKSTLKLKLK